MPNSILTRFLLQEIERGDYQVVITSPENLISATGLKPFVTTYCKTNLIIHIDEAHLIEQWGKSEFRQAWAEIGKCRTFVRASTPFGAYSATLTPDNVETVKKSLHMHPEHFTMINIGNYRPNLYWDAKQLSGGIQSSLHKVVNHLPPFPPTLDSIPLILIFVNSREHGHVVYDAIWRHVPEHLRDQVHLTHSLRAEGTNSRIMKAIFTEQRGILICTERAATVSTNVFKVTM